MDRYAKKKFFSQPSLPHKPPFSPPKIPYLRNQKKALSRSTRSRPKLRLKIQKSPSLHRKKIHASRTKASRLKPRPQAVVAAQQGRANKYIYMNIRERGMPSELRVRVHIIRARILRHPLLLLGHPLFIDAIPSFEIYLFN